MSHQNTEERSRALRAIALRGSLWAAASRWSGRVVSFGAFAVLGRLLEPEQFGVVALASAVTGFLGILVDFGLPRFVVHVAVLDAIGRSTLFWSALGLGIAIGAMQALLAPVLAGWVGDDTVQPVLQVMALGYPLSALYGLTSAFQKRELKFRLLAVRGMIAVMASAVVAVSMALLGFGVWALVAQVLCYSGVSLIVLWLADPWLPQLTWSRAVFREGFRYGGTALGAAVLDSMSTYSDGLIIGRRLGVDQLGYYSIAFRLVQVVLDLLVSVVHTVAFPILARAQDNRDLLAAAYRRSVTQGVLLSAPAIAVLVALMPELVVLVFGSKWAAIGGFGAILAVSRALLVPAWFDSALCYAVGRVRAELSLAAVGAVTVVVAAGVGSFWGLTGVAIAMVGRSLVLWPLRMAVSCRITQQPMSGVAAAVLRIWAAGAAAGVAAFLVADRIPSLILATTLGSVAALVTFLGVALLVARTDLLYLLGTLRQVSGNRVRQTRPTT